MAAHIILYNYDKKRTKGWNYIVTCKKNCAHLIFRKTNMMKTEIQNSGYNSAHESKYQR